MYIHTYIHTYVLYIGGADRAGHDSARAARHQVIILLILIHVMILNTCNTTSTNKCNNTNY